MRKKFNLDQSELDGYMTLIHGGRAAGKTYLAGDFLREESLYGPVRFINVAGEDGQLTLRGMGLGDIGETVESYDDFLAAIKEYKEQNVHAIAVDTIHALSRWIMQKVTGSDRLPEVRRGGERNEWGELHHLSYNLHMILRRSAKMVMCTCPSDKSVEQLSGKTFITPDLPGRQAAGCAGWYRFVGYLDVTNLSPTIVQRQLIMTPNGSVIVRQSLPKQITEPIKLPNGPGGWKVIKQAIENSWKENT